LIWIKGQTAAPMPLLMPIKATWAKPQE